MTFYINNDDDQGNIETFHLISFDFIEFIKGNTNSN